jgi:hypothetical protein
MAATLAELPVVQQREGGDEMARWRTALKELARATDHAEERYSSLRDQLVCVLVCGQRCKGVGVRFGVGEGGANSFVSQRLLQEDPTTKSKKKTCAVGAGRQGRAERRRRQRAWAEPAL